MKNNPLSPTPPDPKQGRKHRVGSRTDEGLRELFGHLGEEFDDIHRGVFVTDHPIVAYAYAWARLGDGDNDFGQEDVVDPPVLIGLNLPLEEEYIDTDAMVTAQELLNMAQLIQQEEEEDDEDEESEALEFASGVTRDESYSLEDMYGLSGIGGLIGNFANKMQFYRAAKELSLMLEEQGVPAKEELVELPDGILEKALDKAASLIPQSRLLREVHGDEVVTIIVLPPIRDDLYNKYQLKEYPLVDPSEEIDTYGELDDAGIGMFNEYLLDQGSVLYMDPKGAMQDVNRWHGTSLSVAREAFPDIVTFARFHQGQQQGSAYDWDELEAEREDEEEDI